MKNSLPALVFLGTSLSGHLSADDRLEEVFVTTSGTEIQRRQIGGSVSVINREEIELRGYQSFTDLMSSQMSITATNAGGLGKQSSLRIRGEEGYRTLILVDGVDISDPTGTQVGPQVQHLASSGDIERVEVLRGPQGFTYGADAGGVINILTRQASDGGAAGVAAEHGSFSSQKLDAYLASGSDSGNLFASITQLNTDGFNARSDFPENEDDGYDNVTAHVKLGWNISEGDNANRVQLVMRNVNAETEFDNCGPFSAPIDDCLGTFDQSIGKLSVSLGGEQYSQDIAFSRSWLKRDSKSAGVSAFSSAGGGEKLSYVGSLSVSPETKLVFGADGEREFVEVDDGSDLIRDQLGVFSEAQLTFGKLYVNAGARFDDNEDFGEHLSGRLSSAYIQPIGTQSSLKYRASYGTGFRAPSLFEIDYNDRNGFGEAALISLNEEKSRGYDLGVEYHHQSGVFIELGYFDQEITDEIQFDLVDFSGYLQEDGESSSEGLELSFSLPIIANIELSGNYTYNKTENALGVQRARRPETAINIALNGTFYGDKLSLIINGRHLKDRVDYPFGGDAIALDDYSIVDASVSYKILEGLRIFARAENTADYEYVDIQSFNTAGNAVYGGFQYDI